MVVYESMTYVYKVIKTCVCGIFILTRNDNQLKTNRHFVVIDRAILPVASLAAICITTTNFANTITLVVALSIPVVRSDLRLTSSPSCQLEGSASDQRRTNTVRPTSESPHPEVDVAAHRQSCKVE